MSTSSLAPEPMTSDVLTELDRQIVLATQNGLPVHEQPYALIAKEVNAEVELVKKRILAMLDDGRIRRIGVVPNHYRLGYTANGMSVWDVPDAHADEVGDMVGQLEMVSHCYLRPRALPDWPYNLFAMVHGHHKEEVMQKVDHIAQLLGDKAVSHDVLFSTRILKKTGLRIS